MKQRTYNKPLLQSVIMILLATTSLFNWGTSPAHGNIVIDINVNGPGTTQINNTDYPAAQNSYINDFAQVMSPQDIATIKRMFTKLKKESGIEITVATISSIHDYPTGDSSIESFATHLFNNWGIGDAEKNNGILILVAVTDRDMRIEVGSGYGNSQNTNMKVIIEEYMLHHFKKGNYSKGILKGAQAVIKELENPGATTAFSSTIKRWGGSLFNFLFSGSWVTWLLSALGIGVGYKGYKRYRRNEPRSCPQCATQMQKLDEIRDNHFLNTGQNLEENIKSVDYDVWLCPACEFNTVEAFNTIFTKYNDCSACGYKTLERSIEIVTEATRYSEGENRYTKTCQHCDHYSVSYVVIPIITESSSSGGSGGSSGGGSSSGGGASGSW